MMISAAVESRCATAGALKSVIRTQSAWGTRLHKVFQSFSTPQKAGIVANMTGSTVAQYLAALPADRRAALTAVRKTINENLPEG